MAASAPGPPSLPAPVSYIDPGSVIVQKAANQILDLIEHEKAIAGREKDATIKELSALHESVSKALQDCKNQQAEASARHLHEMKTLSDELQRVKDSAAVERQRNQDLQPAIDALRRERDQLRQELDTSVFATQEAIEKMGIHKHSSGYFTFSTQWTNLFQELGIEANKPWGPETLHGVIITTAERLRHFRHAHLQPHQLQVPNAVSDPHALQAELARARAYVARLEGELAYYGNCPCHPPPPPPPPPPYTVPYPYPPPPGPPYIPPTT
ncbi:hypothetical protein H1R20_g16203, partial [Candolleomyces eurysporus]